MQEPTKLLQEMKLTDADDDAKQTVCFIAPGTRGDVEPLLQVARELATTDLVHVRFCCHEIYHEFDSSSLLRYVSLSAAGHPEESRGGGPTAQGKQAEKIWEKQLDEYDECISNASLVVFNWFGTPAVHACQKSKTKAVALWPVPFTQTEAFPSFLFSSPKMKHCVEKFGCKGSHIFWEKLFWSSSQVPISKWRQRNHLPPLSELSTTTMTGHFGVIKHLHIPVLNCFSEHVIPKPFDWPKQNIITGYIRSKGGCERAHDQMQIPQHILILRKQSRHTVYVGFGSACRSLKEPAQVLLSVLEGIAAAFHDSTCAVMVQSALVKLADISKDGIKATAKANGLRIEVVDYLPFGTLLPLVDIAFHHGGAGTFASCLQAGCTQIIIPLEFDNFFWGERAHALGVGPEPLMAAEMKTSDVIESLRTARSDAALEKARSIQQKIQEEEDGTDVICRKILSEMDLGI